MIQKIFLVAIFAVIIGGVWWSFARREGAPAGTPAASYKDATYLIEGVLVTLVNGMAEAPAAPGSASKIVTRYFGNELHTDLDGDGREDVVFLLTQERGGSGTFFYVVAALDTGSGWKGSDAYFLGDRIAPQTINRGEGKQIVVNYADRNPGEDFSVQPSAGKSAYLILDPVTMQFGIVAHDFEGEADPSRMTLGMKVWSWVSAADRGTTMTPKRADAFALSFKDDGTFSATTDCNAIGGKYATRQSAISFTDIAMTEM